MAHSSHHWVNLTSPGALADEELSQITQDFAQRSTPLSVDLDGAKSRPAKGNPRPSAGWIDQLMVTGDRRLLARVEWTPLGRDAVDGQSHRHAFPYLVRNSRCPRTGDPIGTTLAGATLISDRELSSRKIRPKHPPIRRPKICAVDRGRAQYRLSRRLADIQAPPPDTLTGADLVAHVARMSRATGTVVCTSRREPLQWIAI